MLIYRLTILFRNGITREFFTSANNMEQATAFFERILKYDQFYMNNKDRIKSRNIERYYGPDNSD